MRRLQKIIVLIFICGIMALSFGCGRQTGVTSPEQVAWLSFVGNTKGAVFVIDNGASVALSTSKKDDKWYEVAPGKHAILVMRNNKIVVKRTVLIGNQQTKEIRVP